MPVLCLLTAVAAIVNWIDAKFWVSDYFLKFSIKIHKFYKNISESISRYLFLYVLVYRGINILLPRDSIQF